MSIWVDSDEKLNHMLSALSDKYLLAVDTEFIRTNTFYPKIALIQISDGTQCFLVDVLAFRDFEGLKQLMEDPSRTLIFHACAEDLEVLEHGLNIIPDNIFDTQIAAGIANVGYSMGYARLVHRLFEVELDKQETRSDWLARPLTDRQIEYAAYDVAYLHSMYGILTTMLSEQERQAWFEEESLAVYTLVSDRKNTQDYHRKVKGAWKLGNESLTALKRLCDWREVTARSLDKPRSHVVKDNSLLEIARRMPVVLTEMQGIDDLYGGTIKRHGNALLQEVSIARHDQPLQRLPEPLSKSVSAVMKAMRVGLNALAEGIELPQEFLSNKKELESIVRSASEGSCVWPDRLNAGWREGLVKSVLQEVLIEAKLQ